MFPIITIPANVPRDLEPLGTKFKFWFRDDNQLYTLFKEARPNTGEDWAEKIASELCSWLGLPHASYDLAVWKGMSGVVSRSFVPKDGRLELGNELLAKIVPEYPKRQFFHVRQHTLRRVFAVLRSPDLLAPLAWKGMPSAPVDIFVGYLMLDAWIANQDRHHENWGLVVTLERTKHLAPSYDHASSLGSNETDKTRESRLTTRDRRYAMEHYVTRARSAFFTSSSDKQPMSTLEAFLWAGKRRPAAAKSWLNCLEGVSNQDVYRLFERVPDHRISAIAIEFSVKMLGLNQQRLLALNKELE